MGKERAWYAGLGSQEYLLCPATQLIYSNTTVKYSIAADY